MNQQWHDGRVSVIHLANGHTVHRSVNGLDLEHATGFVYTGGRDIDVQRLGETNAWVDVPLGIGGRS